MYNNDDSKFHKFAYEGKKSKLKSLLKNEPNINVDELDFDGHTALYYSCLHGHRSCVKLLLENKANPNERCKNGATAVHAAACSGSTKIMLLLLEYDGDLRLHDYEGKAPKAWAMHQPNANLRRNMLAFIEEARFKTLQTTTKLSAADSFTFNVNPKSTDQLVNPCSVGFGTLYKSVNEIGVPVVLPAVNESQLVHDEMGPTLANGAFMVYESMRWKQTHLVTVKRLHSSCVDGGCVDLLIDELKYLRRINHFPKIIGCMGFCYTENVENMTLMFERIAIGSLYNILHQIKLTKVPKIRSITEIILSVCDALIYLHEQNLVHCYVNSHSIFLTSSHTAKLGNLEYCVEKCTDQNKQQKKSRVVDNRYINCSWNWLAPELMIENSVANDSTDMYSFCCVIWELFNLTIPWKDLEWYQIKEAILMESKSLAVNFDVIPLPFNRIVKDGLDLNCIQRMSFEEVRLNLENLQVSLSQSSGESRYVKTPHQQTQLRKKHSSRLSVNNLCFSSNNNNNSEPSKLRNNSFSEGIAAVVENSNENGTLNSLEDIDKFSQLSAYSFICCDAYKTEIHLTNKGISKKLSSSLSQLNDNNNNNIINNSHQSRLDSHHHHHHHQHLNNNNKYVKVPRSNSLNQNRSFNENEPLYEKIDQHKSKKSSEASVKKFSKNVRSSRPPQPPSAPNQQLYSTNFNNSKKSPSSVQIKSKTVRSSSASLQSHNQLPPPPNQPPPAPPLPDSLSHSIAKNHKKLLQPPSLPAPPIPVASQLTPSVILEKKKSLKATTPLNTSTVSPRQSPLHVRGSRSVDSPRISFTSQQPTKSSEIKDYYNNRQQQNDQYHYNDEINFTNDDYLNQQKREKLRLLEALYQKNPNALNEENKSKLLDALTRQKLIRKQAQQIQHASISNQNQQTNENNQSAKSNRSLNRYGSHNNLDKIQSPNLNLQIQNQTPFEKKQYFRGKNIFEAGDDKIQSPPLNKKLDLTTLSQEDNNDERVGKIENNSAFQNFKANEKNARAISIKPNEANKNSTNLFKSSSHTALNRQSLSENSNINSNMNSDIQNPKRSPSFSSPSSNVKNHVGSCSQQMYRARLNSFNSVSSAGSGREKQNENDSVTKIQPLPNDFFAGQGSVKNLVQSYEEFPNKEKNESEQKIQMLREERQKELSNLVDKSKLAVNNYSNITEIIEMNINRIQSEQQQEQVQQQPPNGMINQLKLSTISERTEHSSPSLIGNGGADMTALTTAGIVTNSGISSNNNTTTGGVSPQNTNNQNTQNSRSTSVTKSARNLDRFTFLDYSTGGASASGNDLLSIRNTSTISNATSQPILPDPLTNNVNKSNQYTKNSNIAVLKNSKITEEYNANDESDDEDDSSDSDDEEDLGKNKKYKYENRFIPNLNNNNNNTKSFYSSQEDILSSLRCVESSIECSEEVYLNDFDKFAHLHTATTTKHMQSFFDKQKLATNSSLSIVRTRNNDLNESFNKYSSTLIIDQEFDNQNGLGEDLINKQDYPPPPADFCDSNYKNNSVIIASSLNAATSPAINTPFQNETKLSKSADFKKNSQSNLYKNECNSTVSSSSSSSFVAVSTASSLQETSHAGATSSSESGSAKLANIRFNKHVINTSKYKGYSYKMETSSNLTNQYHIKSLLTNEQTGHSLLLANTRVQTPKIFTKVIIDQ